MAAEGCIAIATELGNSQTLDPANKLPHSLWLRGTGTVKRYVHSGLETLEAG